MVFNTSLFVDALLGWPLARGALITLALSIGVMALSMVISVGTGSLAGSPRRWIRHGISSYVWLFRGAPALLVLLFIWNGLPQINAMFRGDWFNPFLAAFIALTLIQIAYLTEIFRSAFAAVSQGQKEGAAALGLHDGQAFFLVVLPQAMRIALPALVNEFISLLKATSLASIISLKELMTVTQFAISTSFQFIEWYSAALIYYMLMVSVLTTLQMKVESILSRGRR